jgi:hypothetical protein
MTPIPLFPIHSLPWVSSKTVRTWSRPVLSSSPMLSSSMTVKDWPSYPNTASYVANQTLPLFPLAMPVVA